MKNFDWDAFCREKIAVWCKTEEEAKDFCKQSYKNGFSWVDEDITYWDAYKEQTCYIDDGYCNKSWFEKYKCNILEWSDYMDKLTNSESDSKTTFTKSDLKDGDVVLRRNGWVEIVIPSVGVLVNKDGHNNFNALTEDLKENTGEPEYDIVEIRRPFMPRHCQFSAFEYGFGDLVYKREEEIEMTLEEVCQALGKKIKIVGGE